MTDMVILLIIFALLAIAYILSTACRKGHPGWDKLCGWSYAHRGLYGGGVPENSMEAFRLARDGGYGVELDVHLLSDGALAVIHDSLLQRTTGADGRVEDLSSEQLKDYCLEGTDNTIPTLQQVLELFSGCAPLIIELKPVGGNYAMLCKKTCAVMDGYEGPYCMESFDPRCVVWLKKNRPDIIRGQLTENYFKSESSRLPAFLKFMLRHQMLNFTTMPDFVGYYFSDRKTLSNVLVRRLWGAHGVAWTLKNKADYDTAVMEGWIPIFEGFKP